jgi:hypothetical protein
VPAHEVPVYEVSAHEVPAHEVLAHEVPAHKVPAEVRSSILTAAGRSIPNEISIIRTARRREL